MRPKREISIWIHTLDHTEKKKTTFICERNNGAPEPTPTLNTSQLIKRPT